ncbi:unnamed protein product [Euphydryas editha]|uniref:Uncharacterized protein n=1 Tax=Euphydryas editha TaxID=104508 RepID=A0AAU9VBU7_EUPED|nr:unnamed protein product [Euphydryas editha]
MEKSANYKSKNKKPAAKAKSTKKKKSDGPTCSMFLAELTRKLAHKKKQDEECPKNIVQTIIESLTNALPVKFSKRPPSKKESPMKIETLQTYAPELLPNDTIEVTQIVTSDSNVIPELVEETPRLRPGFKIPKMPLVSSDVFKTGADKKFNVITEDVAVNTGGEHDVASEIAKHVGTLRKISLIAEEFNQKTAKNLKEIVDSVQEDLLKKLEEINAEQRGSTSKSVL